MPPTELPPTKDRPLVPTLRRFLPYLWPADAPGLKLRIVVAMTFVVLSKVVQVYVAAYALRYAVDAMSGRNDWGVIDLPHFVMLMIFGYAAGRLSSVVFDNLRNVVFERVGRKRRARSRRRCSAICTSCRCASISNAAPARSPRWSSAARRASTRCCTSCCSTSRRPSSNSVS
jgi:hypothetical protein